MGFSETKKFIFFLTTNQFRISLLRIPIFLQPYENKS
jgi:hypothetical protein